MKLEWSVFALADRDDIFSFIEADSPRSAIKVDDAIRTHVERLATFPESGRIGRVPGTRELVITELPYIVGYRVTADAVRILRILHSAQPWPDNLPH